MPRLMLKVFAVVLMSYAVHAAASVSSDILIERFACCGPKPIVSIEELDYNTDEHKIQDPPAPDAFPQLIAQTSFHDGFTPLLTPAHSPTARAFAESTNDDILLANSILTYQFSVVGSIGQAVPISYIGNRSLGLFGSGYLQAGIAFDVHTGTFGSVSYHQFAQYQSYCLSDPDMPGNPGINCEFDNQFSGNFIAPEGESLTVQLSAGVQVATAGSNAGAYIDPYFQIDPAWAATHPGVYLKFDAGVDNISAVPEPASAPLFLLGLTFLSWIVSISNGYARGASSRRPVRGRYAG